MEYGHGASGMRYQVYGVSGIGHGVWGRNIRHGLWAVGYRLWAVGYEL